MPVDPLTGNHRQTAELLGISEQALWKAVKERGCPVLEQRRKNGGETRYHFPAVVAWRLMDIAQDPDELNLERERARLAKAQADKTEIEVLELRGQLIRREVVLATWQAMIGSMRSKMLAVPTKAAPQMVEPARLAEATAVIRAFVNEALQEVAGDGIPPNVPDRSEPADARGSDGETAPRAHRKRLGRPAPDAKPGRKRGTRKVAD